MNPEVCDKYSTGTHENWYPVLCGQCDGGAKLCNGCKLVVCAKCGKHLSERRGGNTRTPRQMGACFRDCAV